MKLAHKLQLLSLTAAVLLPTAAAALDYRYLDGGFVDRDASTGLGVRMAGSAALTPPLALFGEVVDDDQFTQVSAGALFHAPIGTQLDFNAGGSVEIVDTGAGDDTGLGARMGLRWMVPDTRGLELSPEVRHVVFDSSITSVRANALYPLTRSLLMQGALQGGDDDRIEIGVRYNFGPAASTHRASGEEPTEQASAE
jgi:hypothetical protein